MTITPAELSQQIRDEVLDYLVVIAKGYNLKYTVTDNELTIQLPEIIEEES